MAILSKGTTYSDGDQVTSSNLNALVDSATFASGAVDDSTTQLSSGAIIVKDLGIATGKIATSAVTTAKIADSNVTKAKIENLADYKVLGNVSGGAAAPAEVAILDEDNMSSNSATSLATQQSIKAYVDTQLTAEDLDFAGDGGTTGSVDLDSESLTIAGSTGIDTAASSQTLTVSLDLNELATETSIAQDDFVAMVDNTDSGNGKITFSNLEDTIFGNVSGAVAIAAGGAATVSAVTVADESSDTTCFPLFATAATGSLGPKSGSNLTFNSSSGLLTATTLSGILADGVTATTQSAGDNSTKVATTAYVDAQVATSDALSEVLAVGNTTGSTNIVVTAGQAITTDTVSETTGDAGVTIDGVLIKDNAITASGEIDGGSLDISGNADIDGTTNLDAVDIDGNVQIDGTVTVGVDDTGYDVKFFGDTSGAYIQFDASADKLLTAGGATVDIVKDKLLIGGTAVTTTAAELNVLDGVTAGTVTASKGIVVDSNKDIASFRNITLTGELDAGSLDVSGDADIDGTLETDALSIASTVVTATAAELNYNDTGASVGTVVASKTVTVDSNKDVSSFRNITLTGELDAGSLDVSGDIDVDGTTNLDAVDIDGAVDMASNLTIDGDLSVKGGGSGSIVVNDEDSSLCPTMTFLRNGGGTTTNDFIKFENSGGEVAAINASGGGYFSANVGIGTASPGAKLSISDGNIGIDGNGSAQQFFGSGGNVAGTDTSGGVLTVLGHSPNAVGDLSTPPYNGSNFVGAAGLMARGFSESGQYRGSLEFFTKTASATNATSRMLISHDGNVGIGTTSPSKALVVNENDSECVIVVTSSDSGTAGIYFGDQSDEIIGGVVFDNSTDKLQLRSSNNNTAVTINSSEKVGIGTDSPDELLHVKGGSDRPLVVESTDAFCFISLNDNSTSAQSAVMIGAQGDDLRIDAGDSERIRVESNGNVGINDSTPSERLSVSGNVSITGSISKGSGSFKIPHPLESKRDTHNLVHSFLESPQANLIYRGRVDLVDGVASVNIDTASGMTDGTFVLLCRDVQSFTTNESGWTAVRSSVEGNILTIEAQDNTCTDSISWMVVGERQDEHMYETEWTDENGKVIVEPLIPPPPPPPEPEAEEETTE